LDAIVPTRRLVFSFYSVNSSIDLLKVQENCDDRSGYDYCNSSENIKTGRVEGLIQLVIGAMPLLPHAQTLSGPCACRELLENCQHSKGKFAAVCL
jgi:hypothetical protein